MKRQSAPLNQNIQVLYKMDEKSVFVRHNCLHGSFLSLTPDLRVAYETTLCVFLTLLLNSLDKCHLPYSKIVFSRRDLPFCSPNLSFSSPNKSFPTFSEKLCVAKETMPHSCLLEVPTNANGDHRRSRYVSRTSFLGTKSTATLGQIGSSLEGICLTPSKL